MSGRDRDGPGADAPVPGTGIAGTAGIAPGTPVALDLRFTPDEDADEAAFLAALLAAGIDRAGPSGDADGAGPIEATVAATFDADAIRAAEERVAGIALQHGYRPDGRALRLADHGDGGLDDAPGVDADTSSGWDWETQRADTEAVWTELATEYGLERGMAIALDLQFVPDAGADRAGFVGALRSAGRFRIELAVDEEGTEAVQATADTIFDPAAIWDAEEAATRLALQHGYRPDGWGFWEPEET